jgi:hypothetical protein
VVHAQIGKDGSARQLLAFYQFNGEYFTGLYLVKTGNKIFSDAEVLRWTEVAGVMKDRLALANRG